MLSKFLKKLFGNDNDRVLYKIHKIVNHINDIESHFKNLSDVELKNKTIEFRQRLNKNELLENLIPEAFATVRESSIRIFGMRHFDVQLIGGIILNDRCIAEMRTGEGKTLTSTLPAYLNALTGKGVHIVTVNDYLAKRDAENNRALFEFLGVSVAVNLSGMSSNEKRIAYNADITYGTNNEYGFDYLRDNMVFSSDERVQRKLYYALIDEVDSVLIDEARTPLIISGPAENSSDLYVKINNIIPNLILQDKEDSDKFKGNGDFSIDEKAQQVYLTERGLIKIEKLLVTQNIMQEGQSLYSSNNIILMHHVIAALRAHALFRRDVDYIIKNGEIIIVDEHTGRMMHGRRWSDGLHQAIEAKERLKIQSENQTLASITLQNYFRLYEKLAGMTGTAKTEEFEFSSIYKLKTIIVPTNKPMIRKDLPDLVYITEKEKIIAIINDIKKRTATKQPILVGTVSIEKSEMISKALINAGIKHNILNAKFHAIEANIIAQAGKAGKVTIATNMAGRGTDIMLGGCYQEEIKVLQNPTNEQIQQIKSIWEKNHEVVLQAGGLHIIGTERHESRRIDNQLRGRAGRQGDVGSSRFYLSMEDSLMRIFTSERISNMMYKIGIKYGEAIEHPWVTKAIANAQRKVESRNFDIRKQLLEYDDVANDQRYAIYNQRNEILNSSDLSKIIINIREDVFRNTINIHFPIDALVESCDLLNLEKCFNDDFNLNISIQQIIDKNKNFNSTTLYDYVISIALINYSKKEEILGYDMMRNLEKGIMLQTLDTLWKDHLASIDYLRQGIHLRGYAQKDPKQEYKRESFNMFSNMLETLKYDVISLLSKIKLTNNDPEHNNDINLNFIKKEYFHSISNNEINIVKKIKSNKTGNIKIGRNNPCYCGSGKKFKHCHGKII